MDHDRIARPFPAEPMPFNEPTLPFEVSSSSVPPNLVACAVPPSLVVASWVLYQLAYERALATARASRLERVNRVSAN